MLIGRRAMMVARFGERGEAWVAAQGLLIVLAIAAPRWERPWPPALRRAGLSAGVPIALTGAALLVAGSQRLGRNLTPMPKPKEGSELVEGGVYGIVRHPIYSGILLILFGGALATGAAGFFDAKARLEEVWLAERYPNYPAYQRRARKLIPGLY